MRLLWWFVPEEWWPRIGAGLVAAWMMGAVRLRTLLAAAAVLLLWPYLDAWLGGLPFWIRYALGGLVALAFLRDLLAFFLGDRAADHAVGSLVGYLLRLPFLLLGVPFRLARSALRSLLYPQERMPWS